MSDFRKRQTTKLGRIADSGLGYFNDLLGEDFGDGIGPVAEFERPQTILVGGSERSNVLGGKGRILQEPPRLPKNSRTLCATSGNSCLAAHLTTQGSESEHSSVCSRRWNQMKI